MRSHLFLSELCRHLKALMFDCSALFIIYKNYIVLTMCLEMFYAGEEIVNMVFIFWENLNLEVIENFNGLELRIGNVTRTKLFESA